MIINMQNIPLSLYIHMPWCIRKCPYCDFNSHALKNELPEAEYIQRLIVELQQQLSLINHRPIHSIFIGGGTPSLFSPESYGKLFHFIEHTLMLENECEITLEANPGTVEQTNFDGYRQIGINRLSLGVQSFQMDKLKSLGRIHNGDEAIRAMDIARRAGFTNINIDLMHGLPKQTIEDALYDLNMALSLSPTHLSWYQLTLEPNTYFYKHPPRLPKDETLWNIQQRGHQLLTQHRFTHYEVSAYCQPHYRCRHNLNYWEFGDYLGLGAGAHSKITHANGQVSRHANVKNPKRYLDLQQSPIEENKVLTTEELAFEFMLNALRLQQPISYQLFSERTGLTLAHIHQPLQLAQQYQFMQLTDTHLSLTALGTQFLNDVTELFL